jgi:hypothetical protein
MFRDALSILQWFFLPSIQADTDVATMKNATISVALLMAALA